MKPIQLPLSGLCFLVKISLLISLMFVIGMWLGMTKAYAETKSGLSVPGIGNVATAKTTGTPLSGAKGYATSTTTLYYLEAHIKIWHTGAVLQDSNLQTWNSSVGGSTNTVTSLGFGDYAVTRSRFQAAPIYSTVAYYTSDTGVHSCQNAWNTYTSPC